MKSTLRSIQIVILFSAVCCGCQTRHGPTKEEVAPLSVEEVEGLWVWYWQVIEAERDSTAPDSRPITPPPLDKLTSKRLMEIKGAWGCDARWDDGDDPNTAVIEFLPRSSFRIEWKDGGESGIWVARSNRVELYAIEEEAEPDFRFFVISVSNQWQLVNADAAVGMSPLYKLGSKN